MKAIIFGKTGMLGNYVYKTLMTDYEVISIDRADFDIECCDWNKLDDKIKIYSKNDVIINCIGSIPQRKPNIRQLIIVNTIFPLKLNEIAKKYELKIIHITTDCVFSGKKGNYNENDIHDCEDNYGITKSLGENIEGCIIRTSIIGEEINNKLSLLEWVKGNKNKTITGYTNFYWNGVTCLTLSKIIKDIINNDKYWSGVKHVYSPNIVSKFELCNMINKIYELNINIVEVEINETKYMTLSTTDRGCIIPGDVWSEDRMPSITNLEGSFATEGIWIQPYNSNYRIESIENQIKELHDCSFKYITPNFLVGITLNFGERSEASQLLSSKVALLPVGDLRSQPCSPYGAAKENFGERSEASQLLSSKVGDRMS